MVGKIILSKLSLLLSVGRFLHLHSCHHKMLAIFLRLACTLVVMSKLRKLHFYRYILKYQTMQLHHEVLKSTWRYCSLIIIIIQWQCITVTTSRTYSRASLGQPMSWMTNSSSPPTKAYLEQIWYTMRWPLLSHYPLIPNHFVLLRRVVVQDKFYCIISAAKMWPFLVTNCRTYSSHSA